MKKIALLILLGACGAFFAFSDETEEDGPDMRPLVYLDEAAISNKTGNARANFSGLIDRLNNALTESGIYRVLTPNDIGSGLVREQLFKSLASDGGKDRAIQTPAFEIAMTIMQYGFAAADSKDMYGRSTNTRQAKIELILRIVDMRSRETVKSKNVSRSATGNATVASNLEEQVLQSASKAVVDDIVNALVALTPFSVLDVENGDVTVDVPASRVKPGSQLTVYKKGKKVRNKRTGKMTSKESQVAVIGVQTLGEDSVTCKLLSGAISPDASAEEGFEYDAYTVRLTEEPPAAPSAVVPPVGTAVAPF